MKPYGVYLEFEGKVAELEALERRFRDNCAAIVFDGVELVPGDTGWGRLLLREEEMSGYELAEWVGALAMTLASTLESVDMADGAISAPTLPEAVREAGISSS